MKSKYSKLFLLVVIISFNLSSLYAQVSVSESFKSTNNDLAFNLSMNLSSTSELMETTSDFGLSPRLISGLGMSLRYYLSDHVAIRSSYSFYNTRARTEGPTTNSLNEIDGFREWLLKAGLMFTTRGTNKIESYLYTDFAFGRSESRNKLDMAGSPNRTYRTDLYSTFKINGGLGFNFYFAPKIAFGAELGPGLTFLKNLNDDQEVKDIKQFKSSVGGKVGFTVTF